MRRKLIEQIAQLLEEKNLANVKIHDGDARPLLEALPEACFERIYLLYPDPWPKARHHKRRLFQPALVTAAVQCLRHGGHWAVQTDHAEYFEIIRGLLLGHAELREVPFEVERADWHVAVNPLGGIPALVEGDFRLAESNTILRYLADREGRDDLDPRDPQARATVDWVLDLWALVVRPALFPYESAQYGIVPGRGMFAKEAAPVAEVQELFAKATPRLRMALDVLDPAGPCERRVGDRVEVTDDEVDGHAEGHAGVHAAADAVAGLEDHHVDAGIAQLGAAQVGVLQVGLVELRFGEVGLAQVSFGSHAGIFGAGFHVVRHLPPSRRA